MCPSTVLPTRTSVSIGNAARPRHIRAQRIRGIAGQERHGQGGAYAGHALMGHRHGLLLDFHINQATGTGQREIVAGLID